jgi:integrase
MSDSTKPYLSREVPKPRKPYPDFPLTPHPNGTWVKKIKGRLYYFGRWYVRVEGKLTRVEGDGAQAALNEYVEKREGIYTGRTPRVEGDGLVVRELCNRFLTSKLRRVETGEMGQRSFRDYKMVTDFIVNQFGSNRLVDDLAADDFAALRTAMARKWGPVRLANSITRVKSVFKYGTDNGLIERAVRYGSEFNKPDKSVMRRHKAKNPAKLFTAEEVRAMIDGALVVGENGPELVKPDPTLRAILLFGINAGFGNTDVAELKSAGLHLEGGWLDYPRTKTGVPRRVPLWAETVAAVRDAEAVRPKPAETRDCGKVFLTSRGNSFIRVGERATKDQVAIQFARLVTRLGIHRKGVGFYSVRHTFRTVADGCKDQPAIDHIMGHSKDDMASVYREKVEDDRLRAVANHVRKWLWPE